MFFDIPLQSPALFLNLGPNTLTQKSLVAPFLFLERGCTTAISAYNKKPSEREAPMTLMAFTI